MTVHAEDVANVHNQCHTVWNVLDRSAEGTSLGLGDGAGDGADVGVGLIAGSGQADWCA
jgi:hypothetical protein